MTSDEFVNMVARMRLDGEEVESDGVEWEWENDDAWATLMGLIETARSIQTSKNNAEVG